MTDPLKITPAEPFASYDVGAEPTAGPFNVQWQFFDLTDFRVFVGDLEFTYAAVPGIGQFKSVGVAADATVSGGYQTGTIILGELVANTKVSIVGAIPIARETNFPNSGRFSMPVLNLQLNKVFAVLKQVLVGSRRSLIVPDNEIGQMVIPSVEQRANRLFGFDENGQPTTFLGAGDLAGVQVPVPVTHGGTGAATAANARANLGLGNAATKDAGAAAGQVPVLNADAELPPVHVPRRFRTAATAAAFLFSR